MTNDLRDQLLTWVSHQEEVLKRRIKLGGETRFAEGALCTLLDVKVFIVTEGACNSLTVEDMLVK